MKVTRTVLKRVIKEEIDNMRTRRRNSVSSQRYTLQEAEEILNEGMLEKVQGLVMKALQSPQVKQFLLAQIKELSAKATAGVEAATAAPAAAPAAAPVKKVAPTAPAV